MTDTAGKVITCKGAVCWGLNQPLSIEDIEVDPPGNNEVRIKVIANGMCKSDIAAQCGIIQYPFPVILGHEAGGIVESVGPGVTYLKKGDYVIPSMNMQCRECSDCNSKAKSRCPKYLPSQFGGVMADGTLRVTCKGQKIHQMVGIGSLAEYTVVPIDGIVKVPEDSPLDKVCLLGCGVATGYGAAINDAKVHEGSTCGVWGLGGIGLAVILGCKRQKAKRIFAIDTNPEKKEIALKLGATDFINPMTIDGTVEEEIMKLTGSGINYSFECIGLIKTIESAIRSLNAANGVFCAIGVTDRDAKLEINPMELFMGKSLTGSFIGGWKIRKELPLLVNEYKTGDLKLDDLISEYSPLDQVNEVIERLKSSKIIRGVIKIGTA